MLPFRILYQDNYYIIIDKPAGMPVYSSDKNVSIPSVEKFFPLLSRRKEGPWLVHRLDQDTAGCLLIALRKQALIKAQACFAQHKVNKVYWAIVQGRPKKYSGIITSPLLKITQKGQWKMIQDNKGQNALTKWKFLKGDNTCSLIELNLQTGRTHQARAHCSIMGHPIIGDTIYGAKKYSSIPLSLLSRTLTLQLETAISATAQPPQHMLHYINKFSIYKKS